LTDNKNSTEITQPVLVLVGPTAVGKTDLSLKLSHEFNCEIISIDSMQVYRYMDIGTAKASPQEREDIPHHLIDIVDPDDEYNAARFIRDGLTAIQKIHNKGAIPLLTGGSGLYLRALRYGLFPEVPTDSTLRKELKQRIKEEGSIKLHRELAGHDPVSAAKIHPNDSYRIVRALEIFLSSGIPLSKHIEQQRQGDVEPLFSHLLTIGLTCPREELYERIDKRATQMIEGGLEDEVRGLLARGYGPGLKSMQSIGYRHVTNYISGTWTLEETKNLLARDTRHYAKRQFTWFNRDQTIKWIDRQDHSEIFRQVSSWLLNNRSV